MAPGHWPTGHGEALHSDPNRRNHAELGTFQSSDGGRVDWIMRGGKYLGLVAEKKDSLKIL